jgi:hypothetical protein
VHPGHETVTHYFSCSGGTGTDSTKTHRVMLCRLVFLHLVGFVGHVVHSSASGEQNVDTLFFMLGWDRYGFNKKHARTHYAEHVFCIRWDL